MIEQKNFYFTTKTEGKLIKEKTQEILKIGKCPEEIKQYKDAKKINDWLKEKKEE